MKRGIFPLVFHFRAVRGFSLESFYIFNLLFYLPLWSRGFLFVCVGVAVGVVFVVLGHRSCFKPKLNKKICDQKKKSLICMH